jgi:hypothetical protein
MTAEPLTGPHNPARHDAAGARSGRVVYTSTACASAPVDAPVAVR